MGIGVTEYDKKGKPLDENRESNVVAKYDVKEIINSIKEPKELNKSAKELNKEPKELNKSAKELNKEPEELNKSAKELNKEPEELNKEPEELNKEPEELNKGNEFLEVCAVAVISVDEKQKITVFNAELRPHWANKDVGEKLHITQTNVFVDQIDIENLYDLTQEASLNGIDPFSSPAELKKMFDRAESSGLIKSTEKPDFNKNIIIGKKVYFKNGQIADLDENAITYDIGQLERILQAETPEQMKEMVDKIKESRNMDSPTKEATRNVEQQTRGNEGIDMSR